MDALLFSASQFLSDLAWGGWYIPSLHHYLQNKNMRHTLNLFCDWSLIAIRRDPGNTHVDRDAREQHMILLWRAASEVVKSLSLGSPGLSSTAVSSKGAGPVTWAPCLPTVAEARMIWPGLSPGTECPQPSPSKADEPPATYRLEVCTLCFLLSFLPLHVLLHDLLLPPSIAILATSSNILSSNFIYCAL